MLVEIVNGKKRLGPEDVVVRSLENEDKDFIYATWIKNYRCNPSVKRYIDAKTYGAEQSFLVKRLLDRNTTLVASDPDDEDHIYGWICGQHLRELATTIVHYAYVKSSMRGWGIGAMLFGALNHGAAIDGINVFYTHLPPDPDVLRRKHPKSHYNPYLLTR